MLDWSCLLGLPSDPLKDTFMLYKRVTEQYDNPEILKKVRSLIPQDVILKATTKEDGNIIPLLKWFKNEFMKWIPKDPVCEVCVNRCDSPNGVSDSNSISSRSVASAAPIMQIKKIIIGDPWKIRKVEVFGCSVCKSEYAFPRYGEILKIVENKTGRCSEWSMLFGAILSSLGIKTRIVHDFLDHCWNEAMLSYSSSEDGQWVHVDSTLDYPISLNHPHYYEENWRKEYQYVLAFTADKIEDVTKTYTQKWETVHQRRLKNKNNAIDFPKLYSKV